MIEVSVNVRRHAPVVVSSRRYGVVIRDYDMEWGPGITDAFPNGVTNVSRVTRNGLNSKFDTFRNEIWGSGLPATARGSGDMVVRMDERIQRHLHGSNCKRIGISIDPKISGNNFASFTRDNSYAFDAHQAFHDYINDTNTDGDDIRFNWMLTSGALVEILGDEKSRATGNVDSWVVDAINVFKDDLDALSMADVTKYSPPAISRRVRVYTTADNFYYRENLVVPFPQYKNKVVMWSYSNYDYAYIPKDRVQEINSLEERPPIFVY